MASGLRPETDGRKTPQVTGMINVPPGSRIGSGGTLLVRCRYRMWYVWATGVDTSADLL